MLDLTIVIPVLNEERNLLSCLNAIGKGFAHEVLILDSGSSDRTLAIAAEWGASVRTFNWDGKFPKKRNWYLRNHAPSTGWVMFLDADEYLTNSFKDELTTTLSETEKMGFWLNYTIYFIGRKLKGGYPLQKLALFRVGAGEYERIDELDWSRLDMEIHEHPVIEGPIGVIHAKIDHRDFRGVSHYVAKHNDYSTWEARRFLHYASNPAVRAAWTKKQKLKYALVRSPMVGVIYFFGSYFLFAGFRDGVRGFVFALLKLAYFTQIYCKILELLHKDKYLK